MHLQEQVIRIALGLLSALAGEPSTGSNPICKGKERGVFLQWLLHRACKSSGWSKTAERSPEVRARPHAVSLLGPVLPIQWELNQFCAELSSAGSLGAGVQTGSCRCLGNINIPFWSPRHGEQAAVFFAVKYWLASSAHLCEVMNLPTAGSQRARKCFVIALLKRISEPSSVPRQQLVVWSRAGWRHDGWEEVPLVASHCIPEKKWECLCIAKQSQLYVTHTAVWEDAEWEKGMSSCFNHVYVLTIFLLLLSLELLYRGSATACVYVYVLLYTCIFFCCKL